MRVSSYRLSPKKKLAISKVCIVLHLFHTMRRLVGKVNVVVDKRRVDRSRVRLAEVEIGDETGTVSLRARDEQIDVLEQVSARSGAVVLRNCTLELYQGKHIRLAVTKWGKLCVYPDNVPSTPAPPSKMNNDKDFSLIDLSLVASEMVDLHPEGTQNSRQNKSLSDSTDGGRNQGSSKSGGNNSKQKNGRNRRGGKSSGGGNQSHYGGPPRDIGAMSSQSNQRIYQSMHTYPGYDERLDMRQYPSYQPDVITPESAQLILQQQYQFQQMYAHRSTDHLPSNMGQLQSPGMLFQPVSSPPPGSYNYTTRGASPTMPVDVRSIQTGSLMQTPTNPHQYNAMNPDATAFAPNYLSPQGKIDSSIHSSKFCFYF